jgi:hypothetical protein
MGSFSSIKGGGPTIVRYDGKTGDWKIPGQDKSEPLNGHSGVADVYSAMCGFVRYKKEKGEAPHKETGLIFPKDLSPDRESLGDNDPKKWDKGKFSKEAEDPWRLTIELPFTDQDTGADYLLVAQSKTALAAMKNLLGQCRRLADEEDIPFDDDIPV